MRCEIDAGVANFGLAVLGESVGTRLMEPVSTKLYELESAEDRQREDAVLRPGAPYELAARKISEAVGLRLSPDEVQMLGIYGFHYGLGMGWGVVYAVLRGAIGLPPVVAGLTGASLSLIVDDGLTPALGFSAPNSAYPLATHVRGAAADIMYGLGTMAAAETHAAWRPRRLSRTPHMKLLQFSLQPIRRLPKEHLFPDDTRTISR